MQPNPLFGLVPVVLMIPVVALIVAAGVNFKKNPALSGILALLAAGGIVLVVMLFRAMVSGG